MEMRTVLERKAGGTMRHIPYGYRIENGRAVIDEEQVATVREFFQNYISGIIQCHNGRRIVERNGIEIINVLTIRQVH